MSANAKAIIVTAGISYLMVILADRKMLPGLSK